MQWQTDISGDETHTYATVDGRDPIVLASALAEWWDHICIHAGQAADWNVIVADIWAETGRLIGLVQRDDQDVGHDRGARVCLTFSFAANDVAKADFNSGVAHAGADVVFKLLDASIREPALRERLLGLPAEKVWYCQDGYLVAVPDLS